MTGGVPTSTPDSNRRPSLDEQKKDIPSNFPKSDGLENGPNALVVKQPPKDKIFRPNLPNVNDRQTVLRSHLARNRKPIDGPLRNILPKNIKFKEPSKAAVEKYSGWVMESSALLAGGGAASAMAFGGATAISSSVASAIGVSIGATAGSVIPIVGTVVGALVGLAIGTAVGHLVVRYGRSHSHSRYHENARKSLQDQGVKFTKREMDRLQDMGPKQWKHLAEQGAPIIAELRKYSNLKSGSKRWAKQFFYQVAVMSIAKRGYQRAQMDLIAMLQYVEQAKNSVQEAVKKARKEARALAAQEGLTGHMILTLVEEAAAKARRETPDPSVVTAEALFVGLEEFGVDRYRNMKASGPRSDAAAIDQVRANAEESWQKLEETVRQEFGDTAADRFSKRYARYISIAADTEDAKTNLSEARKLRKDLTDFLKPHLAPYDEDIRSQIHGLVDKYAVDLLVGDAPSSACYDAHGNFDRKLIGELVGAAQRLQEIEDGSNLLADNRVSPDTILRRATLPNRISGHADACGHVSTDLYQRFITGAADIYDECAQLLKIPEVQLVQKLVPIRRGGPDRRPDARARAAVQAKNLRYMAELADRLETQKIDQGMARAILRKEAYARSQVELRSKDIRNVVVQRGWSSLLNKNPEAPRPTQVALTEAGFLSMRAKAFFYEARTDPKLEHLTERDAEDLFFRVAAAHWDIGQRDTKHLRRLWEHRFDGLKEIARSGVDIKLAYRALCRGAPTVSEAINCARLRVHVEDVLKLADDNSEEVKKWRAKHFTDVEIAAYRGNLKSWKVQKGIDGKQKVMPGSTLTIDHVGMASLHNSNLTVVEANSLLALGLVRNSKSFSATKLRHHVDAHVVSEEPGGMGGDNQVLMRTIRKTDGRTDERVLKPIPLQGDAQIHTQYKRRVGSNLAATIVNDELGFDAIVDTQLSTRKGNIVISMERVNGHSAAKLHSGDEVFLAVPKNEARYAKLHEAVGRDLAERGAISDDTQKWAYKTLGFSRLRMVGGELQASGDFLTKLLDDPAFVEMLVDLQIIDFLTDELDRHDSNYIIDLRLGPKGVEVVAVKGIDNDGGFGAEDFHPTSVRTMPRVMSRRQVDAVKRMHERRRNNKDGIRVKLEQVIAPSNIAAPIKPDIAFPFKHSRDATAADLPPVDNGNQLSRFNDRLRLLHETVIAAEEGTSPMRPDGHPALTIISNPGPKKALKDDIKIEIDNNNDIDDNIKDDIEDDVKINENLDMQQNADRKNDLDKTWVDKDVKKIMTNTSSLVARNTTLRN